MKLLYKFFIPIWFLCSSSHSETLEDLADLLSANGAGKLVEFVDSKTLEIDTERYLFLENEIRQMGSQEIISPTPQWKLSKLLSGTGVALSLAQGHRYFTNNPVSTLNLEACPANLASSGIAYRTFQNGTLFSFTWSCGTAGCSYWAKLGEEFEVCS